MKINTQQFLTTGAASILYLLVFLPNDHRAIGVSTSSTMRSIILTGPARTHGNNSKILRDLLHLVHSL